MTMTAEITEGLRKAVEAAAIYVAYGTDEQRAELVAALENVGALDPRWHRPTV